MFHAFNLFDPGPEAQGFVVAELKIWAFRRHEAFFIFTSPALLPRLAIRGV